MIRPVLGAARFVAAIAIAISASGRLAAADLTLPVPTIVLYPGDVIRDGLLVDHEFALDPQAGGGFIEDRSVLLGKVAKRTLLPGKPIPVNGVSEPKVVSNGSQVRVVFSEGGLTISTYGAALQAGGVGDMIRIRNPESGIIVTGTVQPDGSVRVSDS
jgi:flagella basal body P-ring formation protein FlgA